jgi:hypothetical protein
MGDWLGTGNLSNRDKKFRPFKEARQFVHSLNLNNIEEWLTYAKSPHMPSDIPTYPDKPYKKNGWINWADWLGKNTFQGNSKKLTFEKAREFVRTLKLKSTKEWANYCSSGNKPSGIPNRPSAVYKDKGWKGWGDWLGTGTIAHFNKRFISLEELKLIVQNKNIKSQSEWHNFYKNLEDKSNIPSNPQSTFKDKGWVNWADFLGKTKI